MNAGVYELIWSTLQSYVADHNWPDCFKNPHFCLASSDLIYLFEINAAKEWDK